MLLKSVQEQSYHEELASLAEGCSVSQRSSIFRLSPFIGDDGLLRVKGRLQFSGICWNEQRKRLISKGNDLTLEKIIDSCQALQGTLQNIVHFEGDQVKSVETMVRSHGPVCKFCNSNHPPLRCSAYGKSCNRCCKMNHFASSKMCKGSNG